MTDREPVELLDPPQKPPKSQEELLEAEREDWLDQQESLEGRGCTD